MGDESNKPPLARRVPGASRPGPVASARPELPKDLLQRMQAVVNAARAQAAAEASQHEVHREDAEADTSPLPRLTAAGVIAAPISNGTVEPDPAAEPDSTASPVHLAKPGPPPNGQDATRRAAKRNRQRSKRERAAQLNYQRAERERRDRLAAERAERERIERQLAEQEREKVARERTAELERQRAAELERRREAEQEEQRRRAAELERQRVAERERARQIARRRAEQDRAQAEHEERPLCVPDAWSLGDLLEQPRPSGRKPLYRRRYGMAAAVAAAAGLLTGILISHARSPHPGTASSVKPSSLDQAAAWVAQQVGRADIVACDPIMCGAIRAHKFSGQLLALHSATPSLAHSGVVVATAAVRSEYGRRLDSVYAPVVMASFGSGSERIDIRAVAPGGATAYLSQLASDLESRKNYGSHLSQNPRILVSPLAQKQMASGQVDSRLLIVITALASMNKLDILGFSDSGPRASAGVPLRSAYLAETPGAPSLKTMIAGLTVTFSSGLVPRSETTSYDGSRAILIGFPAPEPLGLIGPQNG